MRKKNILIALIFVICVPCFAQTNDRWMSMIKWDKDDDFVSIQQEAVNLDETERLEIYNRYKKNVWVGGLVNLYPLGFGSMIQRDYIGHKITVIGEMVGLETVGVGFAMFFSPLFFRFSPMSIEMMKYSVTLYQIGGFTAATFYLFGIIRAFCYPHSYNKKLKAAIWPEPKPATVSIIPSVNIIGGDVAVTVVNIKW